MARKLEQRVTQITDMLLRGESEEIIVSQITEKFNIHDRVVQDEVRVCQIAMDHIRRDGLAHLLWKGTHVGKRLLPNESKNNVSHWVEDFLGQNHRIKTLFMGTGTTVYEIARQIFESKSLDISSVFTSSPLVLCAFLLERPAGMRLSMASGMFYLDTGALIGDDEPESIMRQPVDAVITSFLSLTKKGFRTTENDEVAEKLLNLRPHEYCKTVLIPMSWSKIGVPGGVLVVPTDGSSPFDNLNNQRTYYIITDKPPKDANNVMEINYILAHWNNQPGFKVVEINS